MKIGRTMVDVLSARIGPSHLLTRTPTIRTFPTRELYKEVWLL